jgi:hypothetical protein
MDILRFSTLPLVISFILRCSSRNADAPPPAKTIFDPLTDQMGRARAVQKTVDVNAIATRAAIDSQEAGENPPPGRQDRGDHTP